MSVLCCGEADESNGTEHAQWCQNYDPAKAFAAARREGWAQAIEALRDREAWLEWWRTHPLPSFDEYLNSRAADYLTDRAAALTEDGGQ